MSRKSTTVLRSFFFFFFLLVLLLLFSHDSPGQSEVTKFNLREVFSCKDIFRFEIPVEDLTLMAIVESGQDLEDDLFNVAIGKNSVGFEYSFNIEG